MKEFFNKKIKPHFLKVKNNAKDLLNSLSAATSSDTSANQNTKLTIEELERLNEKAVLVNLNLQREKEEFEDTIEEAYIEKVTRYFKKLLKFFNRGLFWTQTSFLRKFSLF